MHKKERMEDLQNYGGRDFRKSWGIARFDTEQRGIYKVSAIQRASDKRRRAVPKSKRISGKEFRAPDNGRFGKCKPCRPFVSTVFKCAGKTCCKRVYAGRTDIVSQTAANVPNNNRENRLGFEFSVTGENHEFKKDI